MIRLAFVIPTLDQSGAERQLTLLATALPRDAFEVKVIALNRGGPLAEELRMAGIDVHVLKKRFRLDPLTWVRLRSLLHAFQPHIVQSFLFSANSYVRLPGVSPRSCRIIVSERCVDSWKSGWQLALDRRLMSRTHAMTANSASVASFYQGIGVPKDLITVIPNAVAESSSATSVEDSRRRLGLAPHHRVIGFAGRLAPQKRLEDLVWAFQLLHQVVDDVRLVLIGDGPERDALGALATSFGCRDKVIFAGHQPDASSLLATFDAFVLASEFEGMSNSLMEAMSLGIPCVVSDIPPNLELVTHEESGLVFPLGQAPALTRTLKRLLVDSDLAARLGQTAREQMRLHYSVDRMLAAHRSLYDRVLQAD